ncbi:acyl-ACP--UDP-N-acetylglucosamine O-acyltransferase [Marinilabiliaceae bacterium JC017]|nr:acyl-ACP--UDP-N-acetylglucosamine O-acyltransferase [Marinilabiliaceae bacterium JC017]
MENNISTKAEIDESVVIGQDVTIESFAKIDKGVKIGDGTWIGANVTIYEGAKIGKNCKIFPGAVIAAEPQDLKYKGEKTFVEIGDHTTIREYVTINKGTASRGYTKVGNHCLLMAYTHVAHDCVVGDHVILSNSVQVAGEVEINDWAIIGGNSAVHQFCKIGEHAMVSGMSGVLSDVPPYTKVAGMPVIYQGINYVGMKRRAFSREQIDTIHQFYRIIFQENYNTSQAVAHIELNYSPSEERDLILNFIKSATRGIIKSPIKQKKATEAVSD